ncbi:hypothetical protein NDU88_006047 [Pleurodeles waltl]|uniref:Uncharacterized protein n=1 Tax=Pleurodeles waltl TaxID=8319 RepID=A0AAV7UL96_PLEWA|nr:hypothetical protein NDU88_006047 [Pleurodeles waltl]
MGAPGRAATGASVFPHSAKAAALVCCPHLGDGSQGPLHFFAQHGRPDRQFQGCPGPGTCADGGTLLEYGTLMVLISAHMEQAQPRLSALLPGRLLHILGTLWLIHTWSVWCSSGRHSYR